MSTLYNNYYHEKVHLTVLNHQVQFDLILRRFFANKLEKTGLKIFLIRTSFVK